VLCRGCLEEATAERRRRIRELSERGLSPATIAARLGLPGGTVANDLHRLRGRGELRPGRPSGFDPELERELIALYDDGWPLQEIARSLGRHKRTITRQLARLRAQGLVGRRARPVEPWPRSAPAGFAARTDVARELGFESTAGLRARERRIAAEDPDLVARQRVTLTGHDGQLAVFYGPELAARMRTGGPRRPRSRRKP
jgi:transposase